jgi:hypothetical protein
MSGSKSITLGLDRLGIPWSNRKPALDLRTITEQTPVYSIHAQLVEQHVVYYYSKVEHFFDQAHHICQIQSSNNALGERIVP